MPSWLAFGFVAALLLAAAATPVVRVIALRYHLVDEPSARRTNSEPVARGGGVAIGLAFVLVAALLVVVHQVGSSSALRGPRLVAVLIGPVLAAGIGFVDDIFNLRARWQLVAQVALAGGTVILGVTTSRIAMPFSPDGALPLGAWAGVFTLLWIVGTMNSVNFIDGLDGLSMGISLIAAITLGVIYLGPTNGDPEIALLCFVLAGALAGFLRWNFFPASIYPGTSGVLLVAYLLAVLAVLGAAKTAVALLVLGVPVIDAFWTIVRRLLQRRSPFSADRSHVHHRLLDLGLSHRTTVLFIHSITCGLAVLALSLSGTGSLLAFLGLAITFGVGLLVVERAADSRG